VFEICTSLSNVLFDASWWALFSVLEILPFLAWILDLEPGFQFYHLANFFLIRFVLIGLYYFITVCSHLFFVFVFFLAQVGST